MKNGYELETFDSATPYNIRLTQIKKFNLHWHSYIEVYYAKKGLPLSIGICSIMT